MITDSNGCGLQDYLRNIIEETYTDDGNVEISLYQHNRDGDSFPIQGTRSEVLNYVNNFECNSVEDGDNNAFDGKKVAIAILSNRLADDDDETYDKVSMYDSDNESEITVVNLGMDVSNNEEDNNIESNEIDDANARKVPCGKNLVCPDPCTVESFTTESPVSNHDHHSLHSSRSNDRSNDSLVNMSTHGAAVNVNGYNHKPSMNSQQVFQNAPLHPEASWPFIHHNTNITVGDSQIVNNANSNTERSRSSNNHNYNNNNDGGTIINDGTNSGNNDNTNIERYPIDDVPRASD